MAIDAKVRHFEYRRFNYVAVFKGSTQIAALKWAEGDIVRKAMEQLGYTVTYEYKPDGLLIEVILVSAPDDAVCAVNSSHKIKKGDWEPGVIARNEHPPKSIGVCCAACQLDIQEWWNSEYDA